MERGLVSVIVPTYNRAPQVSDALASVFCQTYRRVQLVLVDDGSTDETPEIAERWARLLAASSGTAFTWVRQENRGVCAARNAGLRAARGEFTSFLDSDDLLYPAKLTLQVDYLEAHPEEHAVACFSDVMYEDPGGAVRFERRYFDPADKLAFLVSKWITLNGVATYLFRTAALTRLGGFDERLGRVGDWEYFIRFLLRKNELTVLSRPLCLKREHARSMKRGYYDPEGDRYTVEASREVFARIRESPYRATHLQFLAYPVWRWARVARRAGRDEAASAYCELLGRIEAEVGLPDCLLPDGDGKAPRTEEVRRSLKRIRRRALRNAEVALAGPA